jgi:uncharacterized protein YkwD
MVLRRSALRGLILTTVVAAAVAFFLPSQPASAAVTRATSNAAPAQDSDGYRWVSYYRGLAGLGPVVRNATLEAQEATHVRYLADHSLSCETNVHDELLARAGGCGANRFATAAGKAAANNSNITRVSAQVSGQTAVSNWFGAGFHALTLLDPRLRSTGYASYYAARPTGAKPLAWNFTAGVDVYRGRSGAYNGSTVAFPATNAATPLLSYRVGTESPEPFRSTIASSPCRSWGTKTVVSAPVIVQWPKAARVSTGSGRIIDQTTGRALATCSLIAASYPVGSLPRQFLGGSNGITRAAFYYASAPFVVGHRYQLQVAGGVITTFTATKVPAAPSIRAVGGAGTLTPYWQDNSDGITSHVFQLWSAASCTGSLLGQVRLAAARLTLKSLVRGRIYSVRVTSDRADGGSRWSGCGNYRVS